ncbi:hypothetical protein BRN20_00220, partial [Xanthomonas oryzae pv. oryzae]
RLFACLVAGGAGAFLNALKHHVARTWHWRFERGFSGATNENTNGLLRQFLPKGADLSTVSQEYLNHIA